MSTRDTFLEGMSRAATTVSIITTDGPAGKSGVTVSAFSSVSADSERPSLLVCVNKSSRSADIIRENGRFCVNVLRDSQAWISDAFAGRVQTEDRFGFGTWHQTGLGSWELENAIVSFDCELKSEVLYGSHYILIGEVESAKVAESGPALVYSNRSYGASVPLGAMHSSVREPREGQQVETVSIGCHSTLAPFLVSRIIEGYSHINPNVAIRVYEGTQEHLIHHLGVRDADMLLTYQEELPDWWTHSTLVAELAPYALLPAMHPLADRDTVSLAELAPEPLVLLDAAPSRNYVTSLFTTLGLSPTVAYRSPSYELVRSMVGNGLGYTLLSTRPASPITLDGRLTVARPLAEPCETSKIVLATDTSREISDEARGVHDYIVAQLSLGQ